MSNCHICGSNNFTDELVSEIFKIREELILVEAIPAKVRSRCGEITFSSETAENIRLMFNSNQKPNKSIEVDIFHFSI